MVPETTVTDFQRRVYALLEQIPSGYVTTYGNLAKALQTSPRAIGNALRNNPYAPKVPCHRCIATTGYINGFNGQVFDRASFRRKDGRVLGKSSISAPKGAKIVSETAVQAGGGKVDNVARKLELLATEGVKFDSRGMIKDRRQIWDGPWDVLQF